MKKHSNFWPVFSISAILVATSVYSSAQEKKSWTIENSFQLKTISDLQIAPGKKELLFSVSEKNIAANTTYSSIWKWSASASKPVILTEARGSASVARWSPDGKKIAFLSRDKNGTGLFVMSADGSGKTKLTNLESSNAYLGGLGNNLSWSPDGQRLAFSAAGAKYYKGDFKAPDLPTGNEVMIINRSLYKAPYFYSDLRRTHIWTISAKGGQPKQLTKGDYDYHSFSWSPDGSTIACVSNQTGKDDFNANNDIMLVSTKDSKMIHLTHTEGPEYQVNFSPDGTRLAFEGRLRSNRSKESDAEFIKIYTMPVKGGEAVELTKSLDRWAGGFQWADIGNTVFINVQNEGRRELYSVPAEGGKATPLITDKGQVTSFATAADGTIYYVFGDLTHPDEIYRLTTTENKKEKLTSFNESAFANVATVDAEQFTYTGPDGWKIDGWIMKPVNYKAGNKYPLILDIHGGPHAQYGYRVADRLQEFAANGYVVLFTNPRGSSGKDQAFSDGCVGDIGGKDYEDIMSGVDYAINHYDFIDSNRMGVTGISYGGYLTQWAVTHTNRFKACVPISGIVNLISAWTEGCNSDWFETDMGFMPFEDYEKAWAVSPIKYIRECKTPTLFINGRFDFITSLNQADAMFTALKKLGVDTEIALYPNEGHGVRSQPKHTSDYHRRTIAWFDKYLK